MSQIDTKDNENNNPPSPPFNSPLSKGGYRGVKGGKRGLLGKIKLEDDDYCFVCGEKNPYGLHLKFSLREGKISAEFVSQKTHQGYKDIVHGGLISTLLDEAMVKTALMQEIPAITAEFTIRFKNPLIVGEKAIVEATIVKMNKRIIEASAILKKTDNTIIAEGHAKLLRQD